MIKNLCSSRIGSVGMVKLGWIGNKRKKIIIGAYKRRSNILKLCIL